MHYGVPEGSYATNPDGAARVLEFRTMVQSLHNMSLRVVLDVVYNHTFATGAPLCSLVLAALTWQSSDAAAVDARTVD